MNYEKIHDTIIARAQNRLYDPNIHHNHHVVPLHEDSTSTYTVPLTLKEHYVVHHLRYKMVGTIGNYLAYVLLKYGNIDKETHAKLSRMGGIRGGRTTKNNKRGIFSPDWNRSEELKRRWASGVMPEPYLKRNPDQARINIRKVISEKRGIHSPDWDRAQNNRNVWNRLTPEQKESRLHSLKEACIIGVQKSKSLGKNFSTWDREKQREAAAIGGQIVGKIPMWTNGTKNKRSYTCPGDGFKLGVTLKHKTTKQKFTVYKETI